MNKSEKFALEIILKIAPIVLSIASLIIAYKTYSSQFEEKFMIDSIPAKFLYIDYDNECLVYENEVIITNASRNPSSLIKCDIKFRSQSINNDLSAQFPILFSPAEAKKFVFKTYVPINSDNAALLSVSENALPDALSNNKKYNSISLTLKSIKKTYYRSISLRGN